MSQKKIQVFLLVGLLVLLAGGLTYFLSSPGIVPAEKAHATLGKLQGRPSPVGVEEGGAQPGGKFDFAVHSDWALILRDSGYQLELTLGDQGSAPWIARVVGPEQSSYEGDGDTPENALGNVLAEITLSLAQRVRFEPEAAESSEHNHTVSPDWVFILKSQGFQVEVVPVKGAEGEDLWQAVAIHPNGAQFEGIGTSPALALGDLLESLTRVRFGKRTY